MLVFFANSNYYYLIPAPYSTRAMLEKVPTIWKVFESNPIKYLRKHWYSDSDLLLELYLRGFLIEKTEKNSYLHWEYIFVDENILSYSISDSLCTYLYRRHPLYSFFHNKPNTFFQFVPIQQLHKLLKHVDLLILKSIICRQACLLSTLELPNQSLIQKNFLREEYFGIKLPPLTLQYLFQNGIFYYEDLTQFDSQFFQLLPKLGPIKLSIFAQQYQRVFNYSLMIK
ncbi:hypothetical protein [Fundicoccus culcitae]|uniref:Uncharacterized protein n=1 Tax=Fundicoccus culcitae TaxID=2969821 RepID=A0ABY5P6E5_9LACT|nr:hypothetical protein [Fundicoccus culcitae]UUX33993.1 hypothetical protein NRE15_14095 [Fundicoccus culcitae]